MAAGPIYIKGEGEGHPSPNENSSYMGPYVKSHLFLVAILFVSISKVNGDFPGITHIRVRIFNLLNNPEDMSIHCKDKHHDLGVATIRFKEQFTFRFLADPFLWRSLYFCSFWWPPSSQDRVYYDVYVQKRDRCHECIWFIEENGPCLPDGNCFHWNPPSPSSSTLLAPLSVVTPNNTINFTQPHL